MRYDLVVIGDDSRGLDAAMEAAVTGERVAVVAPLDQRTAERLDLFSVDVLRGEARFVASNAVAVTREADEVRVESERFVIATGARSWRPGWVPFDGERVLTQEDELRHDGRVVVIGAGPTGLLHAVRLAERGIDVTVVEGPELDEIDTELLERAVEAGVRLHLGATTNGVDRFGKMVHVHLVDGRCLETDQAVVAAGWEGNTESLDLGRVGLETDERGRLWCDAEGRTWTPHVSAVGNVVGTVTARRATTGETAGPHFASRRTRQVQHAR